jgi:DUF177 domain-containing protein
VASPYLVPVSRILRHGRGRVDVAFVAPFDAAHDFEPRGPAESDVPSDADVDVALVLEAFQGGISVRGRIASPWRGTCRRCSAEIDDRLTVRVSERYIDRPVPDDDEAYVLSGEFVDLLPLVHDVVLLELPIAPLCRPGCAGLCAQCGADLNEELCSCATHAVG